MSFEPIFDLLFDIIKICAYAVHLIYENNARNMVFIRLTPNGLALRLNAAYRAKYCYRTI